jgi:hypothetical protein
MEYIPQLNADPDQCDIDFELACSSNPCDAHYLCGEALLELLDLTDEQAQERCWI